MFKGGEGRELTKNLPTLSPPSVCHLYPGLPVIHGRAGCSLWKHQNKTCLTILFQETVTSHSFYHFRLCAACVSVSDVSWLARELVTICTDVKIHDSHCQFDARSVRNVVDVADELDLVLPVWSTARFSCYTLGFINNSPQGIIEI